MTNQSSGPSCWSKVEHQLNVFNQLYAGGIFYNSRQKIFVLCWSYLFENYWIQIEMAIQLLVMKSIWDENNIFWFRRSLF